MSKRLQVLFEDEELAEIRRIARQHRMTVAEWVRQALRRARREDAGTDSAGKLEAIRTATRHVYPSGDIAQMLDEIEGGYAVRDER